MQRLRVSILTPSYQQGRYLEENIKSVVDQHYEPFEHIVIDGGSTDNTTEVLKKYPHVRWVSEKDNGQADALNKGLRMATGDIIGWINSDDTYVKDIFPDAMREFEDPGVQWIVGNITTSLEAIETRIRRPSPRITHQSVLHDPDIVRQQGTFFRRVLLEEVGGWNADFHLVMDYDLWIRLAKISTPKMVDKYWACFRMHTDQKTTGRNLIRQTREIGAIMKREGVPGMVRQRIYGRKYFFLLKHTVKGLLLSTGLMPERYRNAPFFRPREN